VVGIIGRNGAGKSTLLKILSRITPPSTGRIEYHGRVASLLEVGTGFHRELTGRENIYLSGSILGMKRAEIARKFSEIISFAEVEKFIDTPVKFYSSGMYVRLAFAVAAHLDPEILLVDEVLAVGDAAFQKKCLGKMSDVAQQGRTVLFVSHNMGAVNRLCSSAVLLSRGSVVAVGEAGQVIRQYTTEEAHTGGCYEQKPDTGKPIHLRRVRATAPDATVRSQFTYHEAVTISIDYDVHQRINGTSVGIGLFVGDGTCAFCSADFDCEPTLLEERAPGSYTTKFTIPAAWLNTDTYIVNVYIANASTGTIYDRVEALSFQIIDSGTPGSYHGAQYRRGVLQPLLQWKTETRTDV
jgi:lipopolysaccharide transport system ATP-binding protein